MAIIKNWFNLFPPKWIISLAYRNLTICKKILRQGLRKESSEFVNCSTLLSKKFLLVKIFDSGVESGVTNNNHRRFCILSLLISKDL